MAATTAVAVGLMFNPCVPEILEYRPEAADYLSVIPDTLQVDNGRRRGHGRDRFLTIEVMLDVIEALSRAWPIVAHGVGLSIGSPGPLDSRYVERMRWWVERLRPAWFSEHLSFFRLPRNSTSIHDAGLAVPLPFERGVLRSIARKARQLQTLLGVPFLLENGVSYLPCDDYELDEPTFLGGLAEMSGTGLLLDLHNLFVQAQNFDLDAFAFIERLPAERILEVHVAGGDELAGMYTDAHSGVVPAQVWALLAHLLPRASALRGVTFEFHESYYPRLGKQGILEQLARARELISDEKQARRVRRTQSEESHEPGLLSA
jgi:hypothetical protein